MYHYISKISIIWSRLHIIRTTTNQLRGRTGDPFPIKELNVRGTEQNKTKRFVSDVWTRLFSFKFSTVLITLYGKMPLIYLLFSQNITVSCRSFMSTRD